MIVWSGLGFLVPAIAFGIWVIMNLMVDGIYGDGADAERVVASAIALLLAAPAIWFSGKALESPGRLVIDKETGEEMILNGPRHTLFFIPMKYWAFPAIAGGLFAIGVALFGS
ncbi:hypothetical protein J2T09_003796 [Neorhizobium huautlense]|uniref:Uncharacterized protein n=1 Tax=Neorhizobium huautlense TaxID=67774 RepID=A0ABT9PX13_9HYPH|nr:hypothetical protein [Neorhizobium huautlense]MDP9839021.1 hypothetical protein [Neorhizobium huautlense]